MLKEIKLLLVDDDEQRCRDMKVILDFLGEELITVKGADWLEQASKVVETPASIVGVMLGKLSQSLEATVKALTEWDAGIPGHYHDRRTP